MFRGWHDIVPAFNLLLPQFDVDELYRCFAYHFYFFTNSSYRYNVQVKTIPLRPNYHHSTHCCNSRSQKVVFGDKKIFQTNDGFWFQMT